MPAVDEPHELKPTCEGSALVHVTEQQRQELLSELSPAEAAEMGHYIVVRES